MKPTGSMSNGRSAYRAPRNGAGLRVAYVASYPPRECGIATFTRDVVQSVAPLTAVEPLVVAMNDVPEGYPYPREVRYTINRDDPAQYLEAADALNKAGVDVVNIQHEYGLFGGYWGEYLLSFVRQLRMPVVTTLHTTLPNPEPRLREVTRALVELSDRVVVLAKSAIPLLAEYYDVDPGKLHYVPHGVPTVERRPGLRHEMKTRLQLEGRRVLATFGLIGPNKGIEHVIRALPGVVAEHPDVLYLVLGETHPGVRRYSGESYRDQLRDLASDLGVSHHVCFDNRYLTLPQLVEYLLATDVYVVPYLDPNQIVSGTLSYALGAGKAVIATPFIFARETLADDRGIIVDFGDPEGIGRGVRRLLGDSRALKAMENRAYEYTRSWVWPAVGAEYYRLFEQTLARGRREVRLKAA